MSDLIYRQQALDALYLVDEYNGRSVEAIRNLPSAESEIIRCKDCKYWDAYPSSTIVPDRHECRSGIHWHTTADDFCSRAERKQDATS